MNIEQLIKKHPLPWRTVGGAWTGYAAEDLHGKFVIEELQEHEAEAVVALANEIHRLRKEQASND